MATAECLWVPTIKGTVPFEGKLGISLPVSSAGKGGAGRNPGLGEQPQAVICAGFMGGFPAGLDTGPLGQRTTQQTFLEQVGMKTNWPSKGAGRS